MWLSLSRATRAALHGVSCSTSGTIGPASPFPLPPLSSPIPCPFPGSLSAYTLRRRLPPLASALDPARSHTAAIAHGSSTIATFPSLSPSPQHYSTSKYTDCRSRKSDALALRQSNVVQITFSVTMAPPKAYPCHGASRLLRKKCSAIFVGIHHKIETMGMCTRPSVRLVTRRHRHGREWLRRRHRAGAAVRAVGACTSLARLRAHGHDGRPADGNRQGRGEGEEIEDASSGREGSSHRTETESQQLFLLSLALCSATWGNCGAKKKDWIYQRLLGTRKSTHSKVRRRRTQGSTYKHGLRRHRRPSARHIIHQYHHWRQNGIPTSCVGP